MTIYNHSFKVRWSVEDNEFIGTCDQYPSLSHLDATAEAALAGIRQLVSNVEKAATTASTIFIDGDEYRLKVKENGDCVYVRSAKTSN